MRIVKIQNSYTNFTGKISRNSGLSRLKQSLNDEQRNSLNRIINGVENSKDNYRWFLEFDKPCDDTVEYAYLDCIQPPMGPVYPKMFFTTLKDDSDALKVFEQLREWYKRSMNDYKE